VGEVNPIVGLLLLILAVIIIEVDDFRFGTILLGFLGGVITIGAVLEGAFVEVLPLAIYSIVFLPLALAIITTRTKRTEEPPLIHGVPSIGLLLMLVIITYVISFSFLGGTGIEWPLVVIGLFGLIVKTDLRKSVASLSILVYSVHLFVPGVDFIIEGMLMLTTGILVLALLVLGHRYFSMKGSMSTRDLTDLRF
jgi:hypothetical protein